MSDKELRMSLEGSHELANPVHDHAKKEMTGFRTKAVKALMEAFPNQAWPVREGICANTLELRFIVKDEAVASFRAHIAQLGLKEVVKKKDEAEGIYDQH